ncbi:GEL complex subunit OPTI [Uranotaenia lowii]|uniref:GEL complex subunit OPTI n=1 Tax=Uranotaenia lowii TaxID=190385 RepID=UPI002479B524|nr:GEL complex subunit OPTI [Uranotaenia lowii]
MVFKSGQNDKKIKSKTSEEKGIWSKAIVPMSEWNDKDEFLDVIYWSRQVLGILIGVVMGLIPLKGFVALALFALVNSGVVYLYSNNFQKIDEEVYGGMWEVIKEGFMTSFACFLVTWIIFYTGTHFDSLTIDEMN